MAKKLQSDKLQWELSIKDSEAQRNIAALTRANKDYEKSNKEIRLEMARLEAQGKRNTDEYRGLKDVLKQNNTEIALNTKQIKQNESVLGTQGMTMNQLKNRYKELLKEMNNTSRATDPKAWESLKAQLDETRGAMGNLAGGTQKAEGVMISWGSAMKVGVMGILASMGQKVLSVVGDLFDLEKIINSNQTTGDRYAATVAGLKGAFAEFRTALATMDFSNFTENLTRAYNIAYEVAWIMDELFERQNSFKIQDIQVKSQIEDLYEQMNNVNLSYKERSDAAQLIQKLTKEQAAVQKEIYKDEADAQKSILSNKTRLNDKELDFFVDQYNANRDVILQAQEYLKLQNQIKEVKRRSTGYVTAYGVTVTNPSNTDDLKAAEKELQEFEILNAKKMAGIKDVAEIAKGYERSNDEVVTNYVESRVKMLSVDVEAEKSLRRVNNNVNSMLKGIATEAAARQKQISQQSKAVQEKSYKDEIDLVDKKNRELQNANKEMYAAGHISLKEYNLKLEQLEQESIEKKIEINLVYSKSIDELQTQLLDKQIAKIAKFKEILEKLKKDADGLADKAAKGVAKDGADAVTKELDDSLAFMDKAAEKASSFFANKKTELDKYQDLYDADLAQLNDALALKLLSEEQYQEAVTNLNQEAWVKRFEINSSGAKRTLEIVQEALAAASQVITAMQQIETSTLDAQKQRELSIYGDSYEKRAEIEQKYEEKKLEVQKKYADIDMGVKVAQALAAGALGIMTVLSQLGAFSAPMVAIISATTAAQVAMIIAQRSAVMNASAGGGSGMSVGTRSIIGGSSSMGSSSVQLPSAQKPVTSSQIGTINNMKGESVEKQSSAAAVQIGVLQELSSALKDLKENPIVAYTVLSQQQAQKAQFDRIKREGSL